MGPGIHLHVSTGTLLKYCLISAGVRTQVLYMDLSTQVLRSTLSMAQQN